MKVLFVEDDPMNRRVVKAMLEVAGAPMDEAESGAIGLEMVDKQAYDLILMDLRMPEMDGITAIQKIRARCDDKGRAPIVVVTADTAPDLRAACLAAGANDFMTKIMVGDS
jgi:two-component system response regulator QseB